MFAYCENNPIRYKDPNGDIIIEAIIVIGVVALVSGLFSGIAAKATGGSFWEGFIEGTLIGGVSAALCLFMPGAYGVLLSGASAFVIDCGVQICTYGINNDWNYDSFKLNLVRSQKAASFAALLSMIPQIGTPKLYKAAAAATAVIWSLASASLTALDTANTVMWNSIFPNNNQNTYRSTGYKKPGRSDWNCFSNCIM